MTFWAHCIFILHEGRRSAWRGCYNYRSTVYRTAVWVQVYDNLQSMVKKMTCLFLQQSSGGH